MTRSDDIQYDQLMISPDFELSSANITLAILFFEEEEDLMGDNEFEYSGFAN